MSTPNKRTEEETAAMGAWLSVHGFTLETFEHFGTLRWTREWYNGSAGTIVYLLVQSHDYGWYFCIRAKPSAEIDKHGEGVNLGTITRPEQVEPFLDAMKRTLPSAF